MEKKENNCMLDLLNAMGILNSNSINKIIILTDEDEPQVGNCIEKLLLSAFNEMEDKDIKIKRVTSPLSIIK